MDGRGLGEAYAQAFIAVAVIGAVVGIAGTVGVSWLFAMGPVGWMVLGGAGCLAVGVAIGWWLNGR